MVEGWERESLRRLAREGRRLVARASIGRSGSGFWHECRTRASVGIAGKGMTGDPGGGGTALIVGATLPGRDVAESRGDGPCEVAGLVGEGVFLSTLGLRVFEEDREAR